MNQHGVEKICPDLFRIQIPLPDTPLKYLNSYVVRSPERNLLIDTGFNSPVCFDAMMKGLTSLDIDLEKTDIFVTHFHADHFSLIPKLKTPGTRIYFNRPDAELLENWQGFGQMLDYGEMNGFPKSDLKVALEAHPGSRFGVEWIPDAALLSEGYRLDYGDYRFNCVETPGHTLGHICLYEPGERLLIAGDHVLGDITPNIQCWKDFENPLKDYLASLDKVNKLDVNRVLPGHRRLFSDLEKRVEELKNHHKDRLEEVLNILETGPQTAFDVASKMDWDINAATWDDFPVAQQWFATGEALSHLRYLEEENRISRDLVGNCYRFSRS